MSEYSLFDYYGAMRHGKFSQSFVVNESRPRDQKFFEVKGFVSIWCIYYYYDYVDLTHFVGSMKIAFVIFLRLIFPY